ncbi:hypothetical protein QVD17_40450 [Tagetes erecta]|uniref:Uncharacterized protein n=1 Tax=Tagetes erecta TaxID=13708 RepID=A0AAD8JTV3_TARER|nr:hypothetical protein QVD17_40450 [Tagetes erecta]
MGIIQLSTAGGEGSIRPIRFILPSQLFHLLLHLHSRSHRPTSCIIFKHSNQNRESVFNDSSSGRIFIVNRFARILVPRKQIDAEQISGTSQAQSTKVAKFCAERLHEVIAEERDQEANDEFKWQQR